jgi:hypothetical protein
MLGDGVLGHTEAGEEGGEAIAALVRQFGPRPGVRARSMALASHCRRATMCEKKDGQRLPYQDFAPGPASLRISDSDERGPGQCSSIISSPPPRRIARNVRATTTASSS